MSRLAMSRDSVPAPRRWAPEWIAVLTLAVAIVALGGGLLASLNAMEGRIRADMRQMEGRIRDDMAPMEQHIREDMTTMERHIREDMAGMDTRIRADMAGVDSRIRADMVLRERGIREDVRELRGDVGLLRERVARLEARFDDEFPPRTASRPSPTAVRTSPPQHVRL